MDTCSYNPANKGAAQPREKFFILIFRSILLLLLVFAGREASAADQTIVLQRTGFDYKRFTVQKDSRVELKNGDSISFYEITLVNAESRKSVATIEELKQDQSIKLGFASQGTYLLHYSVKLTGMDAAEDRYVWIDVVLTSSL